MKRIVFSLWFIVYGLWPFVYAQDETVTLLTWYPAPYGMYIRIGLGEDIQFTEPDEDRTLLKIQDNDRLFSAGTALLSVGTTMESQNSAIFAFQPGIRGVPAYGVRTRIISRRDAGPTGPITASAGYAMGSNLSGNMTGVYGYAFNNSENASSNAYGGNFYALNDSTGTTYGIYADSSNEGSGMAYGVYAVTRQFGTGAHYGIYSSADSINSLAETYGIYNKSNSSNQNGNVFGIYNLASTNGTGAVYGIYSELTATGGEVGLLKTGLGVSTTVQAPDDSPAVGISNETMLSGVGADGDVTGILNTTTSSGTGTTYGISSSTTADGDNSDIAYGIYSFLAVNGADADGHAKYGAYAGAKNYNVGNKSDVFGIRTDGISAGNGNVYGVYAAASANAGAPAPASSYGVYSTASGPAGRTWAGYFDGKILTTGLSTSGDWEVWARQNGGAGGYKFVRDVYDVAELIPCASDVEYGDVVVINLDKDREVIKCAKENESTAGIISEAPQLCFGDREKARELEPEKNWNFLALAGQVYCKVDASYGEINRGDLLTTSPTPGYAMKSVNPKIGTIVGKALEPLKEGKGKILVLVCLM